MSDDLTVEPTIVDGVVTKITLTKKSEGPMTPLDAARRLAAIDPFERCERDAYGECDWCKAAPPTHAPDCPWFQLPQIVAALELQPHFLRVYIAAKSMIVTGFSVSPGGNEDEIAGYRRVRKELFAAIQDIDDFADAQRAAREALAPDA